MESVASRRENARQWLEKFVEGFMFNDIKACIAGNANFAAALALSTYTEILGGILNGSFEDKSEGKFNNYMAFLSFMGYEKLAGKAYGLVRGGLTHQYFIKQESTVFMWITTDERRGIVIDGDNVQFHVVDYFQEFQVAYGKLKKSILEGDDKALRIFEQALSIETLPAEAKIGRPTAVGLPGSSISSS